MTAELDLLVINSVWWGGLSLLSMIFVGGVWTMLSTVSDEEVDQ